MVRKSKEREKITNSDSPGNQKPKSSYELDPIEFRISKLREIEGDICLARDKQIIHSHPTLHKLHLLVHDEGRSLVEQSKDIHGESAEQLQDWVGPGHSIHVTSMFEGLNKTPFSWKTRMDIFGAELVKLAHFVEIVPD